MKKVMKKAGKNIAYIDAANLHRGVRSLGWHLDYARFRIWLQDKYGISQAYLFIGLIPKNKDLYTRLQEAGYTLIFKTVIYDSDGRAKGNCDAELVLKVARDFYENGPGKAVLISSDGDYSCLVKFLLEKERLMAVISPAVAKKCSILLKRTNAKIIYLNDKKELFQAEKRKSPRRGRAS